MLLFSLSKLTSKDGLIDHIFEKCGKALKKWVAHPDVIGGSLFGGSWKGKGRGKLEYGSQEFKV